MTLQPLRTTTGACPRCGLATERFAANEERFEIETHIAHTAARCERVRTQAGPCEDCGQPSDRLRRSRRSGALRCPECRAALRRTMLHVYAVPEPWSARRGG
jgi:ssDNA-binding Zn-finger/Zn-ribbon topoisomerase 1